MSETVRYMVMYLVMYLYVVTLSRDAGGYMQPETAENEPGADPILTCACRCIEGQRLIGQSLANISQDIFQANEQVSGHTVLL